MGEVETMMWRSGGKLRARMSDKARSIGAYMGSLSVWRFARERLETRDVVAERHSF